MKIRKLAAAVVATLGLVSTLSPAAPAAAQSDDEATTTSVVNEGDAAEAPAEPADDTTTTDTTTTEETPTEETAAESAEDGADPEATADADAATSVIAKRGDRGSAVRDLQRRLTDARFSPGVIDGIFGRQTQSALTSFQNTVGLTASGVYDSATAAKLADYTPPATPSSDSDTGSSTSIMSTREAQQRLTDAGFNPGPVDGLYGRQTRAGLEAFQRHVGLTITGRVDSATSEALRNYNGGAPATTPAPGDSDSDAGPAGSLRDAQRALAGGPFDPGPVDGVYGTKTKNAIWALEKLAGITVDGQWSSADQAALQKVLNGSVGGPATTHSRRWVEVDLSQQLMKIYDPGRTVPVLVSHVSSGSGIPWRQGAYSGRSITPIGNFTIFRRISGWRQSSLGIGSLYNPLYFTSSGIAFHGSRSVPSYPASHGCVRVPMHIAEYLPGLLPNGTPVVVMR